MTSRTSQHKLATLGKACVRFEGRAANLDTPSLMQQVDCVRQLGEHFRRLVSLHGRQPEFITSGTTHFVAWPATLTPVCSTSARALPFCYPLSSLACSCSRGSMSRQRTYRSWLRSNQLSSNLQLAGQQPQKLLFNFCSSMRAAGLKACLARRAWQLVHAGTYDEQTNATA